MRIVKVYRLKWSCLGADQLGVIQAIVVGAPVNDSMNGVEYAICTFHDIQIVLVGPQSLLDHTQRNHCRVRGTCVYLRF